MAQPTRRIPDPATIRSIAVKAQVSDRTVRTYFCDLSLGIEPRTRPSLRARIEAAIRKDGHHERR